MEDTGELSADLRDWPITPSLGLGIDSNGRLCSAAWSATGNGPVFSFCPR